MWKLQVQADGDWRDVKPKGGDKPYKWHSRVKAAEMGRLYYEGYNWRVVPATIAYVQEEQHAVAKS